MKIDIHTLAIVLGLTSLLQVIALFAQYQVNKTQRGLGWWALGSATLALGFVFNYLRDNPTLASFAIVANNTLFIFGLLLIYVGVLRFLGQHERCGRLIASCTVFTLVIIYFTYINNDLVVRQAIFAVAIATISFLIAWGLFIHRTRSVNALAYFLAVVFLASGSFFILRALASLAGVVGDLFTPSLIQIATYLDVLIVSTLWTFGFIIMVNQRLNEETREAKENLELIFNTSPDATLISRLHDGVLVNINEGFTALTNFTRAEVIGKSSLEVNIWKNPEDRQKVVTALKEKGSCENLEAVFKRKDGSQLIGMLSAKLITLQGESHIISVTRDITDRKQAEEALRKSETGYREISIKLQDAYLRMSQKKDKIEARKYIESIIFLTADDGRICGFTKEAVGITKKSHSALQGCNIQDILVFQGGQTFMDLIHKARPRMSHLTTIRFRNQLEDGPVYEAKLTRIFVESKRLFYIVLY